MAAAQSISLAYSREDEMAADQMGLDYLNRAGYSAKGLLSMLEKIRSKRWFGSEHIPTYLSTHPALEERLSYIGSWMENHEKQMEPIDPFEFRRAHTRLVAMHGDKSSVLNHFVRAVKESPSDPLAHYGYGLALYRTDNSEKAVEEFKAALQNRAFDPYILKDLGRVYSHKGQYNKALRVLESAVASEPNDPEGQLLLGQVQIELGNLKAAQSTLEGLVDRFNKYNPAYYSLGELFSKQGMMEQGHYYLGIYYKNKGNWKNAAFHLSRSLKMTTDPNKKTEIETMLKEMREMPRG
jgi:predicted Zn-dependent protease